eukprot:scaffold3454_cov449-Ochromonas_danica.AAC.1
MKREGVARIAARRCSLAHLRPICYDRESPTVLSTACLLPLTSSTTAKTKNNNNRKKTTTSSSSTTSSTSPAKSQEVQEEEEEGLCRDLSQHPVATQFFAFALPSMAVIVQLLPEVKILYKWLPSSSSTSPGNEPTKEEAGAGGGGEQ